MPPTGHAAGLLRGMAPTSPACNTLCRPSFAAAALVRRPTSSSATQRAALPLPSRSPHRLSARAATASSGWALRPLTPTPLGPTALGLRCRGLVRPRAGYGEARREMPLPLLLALGVQPHTHVRRTVPIRRNCRPLRLE